MKNFKNNLAAAAALAVVGMLGACRAEAQTVELTITPESGVEFVTPTATWNAPGFKSCTAGGGWSGTKAISGTEILPRVDRDVGYSLACVGDGFLVASWVPPTQNTNGTPLTNLAGYKLLYSANADMSNATVVEINNASATTYRVDGVSPGVKHVVMVAVTTAGIESAASNKPNKNVTAASATATDSVDVETRPNPPTATTIQ